MPAVSGIRRYRQSRNSMKFGQVDNPENIDFTIPPDHPDTAKTLKAQAPQSDILEVYVGCAKWNKADLKNFYPRGTKDELVYYSTQFNCIELNATFTDCFHPQRSKTGIRRRQRTSDSSPNSNKQSRTSDD
jgi:hypothetical protein